MPNKRNAGGCACACTSEPPCTCSVVATVKNACGVNLSGATVSAYTPAVNEVQRFQCSAVPTSGTMVVTRPGFPGSATIGYTYSNGAILSALSTGIPSLAGNIAVTGAPLSTSGFFLVEFINGLAGTDVAMMGTGLIGLARFAAPVSVAVTEQTKGQAEGSTAVATGTTNGSGQATLCFESAGTYVFRATRSLYDETPNATYTVTCPTTVGGPVLTARPATGYALLGACEEPKATSTTFTASFTLKVKTTTCGALFDGFQTWTGTLTYLARNPTTGVGTWAGCFDSGESGDYFEPASASACESSPKLPENLTGSGPLDAWVEVTGCATLSFGYVPRVAVNHFVGPGDPCYPGGTFVAGYLDADPCECRVGGALGGNADVSSCDPLYASRTVTNDVGGTALNFIAED